MQICSANSENRVEVSYENSLARLRMCGTYDIEQNENVSIKIYWAEQDGGQKYRPKGPIFRPKIAFLALRDITIGKY